MTSLSRSLDLQLTICRSMFRERASFSKASSLFLILSSIAVHHLLHGQVGQRLALQGPLTLQVPYRTETGVKVISTAGTMWIVTYPTDTGIKITCSAGTGVDRYLSY